MSILKKVTDFVTGGLFSEIKDGIMAYLPPDLSPQQKLEFELQTQELLNAKTLQANKLMLDASASLDKRIAEQEGTAKDLKAMPYLGALVIFARGAQRPIWGYSTLYFDSQWFLAASKFSEQQQTALIVINCLVLGFLFGERAIQNVMPLITQMFLAKKS
jgi:hypothetical protein